jgi:hypothetical protein
MNMESSSGGTTFVSSSSSGTKMDENVIERLSLRQNSAACAAVFPVDDRPRRRALSYTLAVSISQRSPRLRHKRRRPFLSCLLTGKTGTGKFDADADQQVHRACAPRRIPAAVRRLACELLRSSSSGTKKRVNAV